MDEPQVDRRKDEIAALRQDVRASSHALEALSGSLLQYGIHADEQNQALRKEVYDHRKLAKYSRRTHFYTMAAMVYGALIASDLAHHANSGWWGLIFWATQHGHGGAWEWTARAVGFTWQTVYLIFLVKIAQVPEDLWNAAKQVKKERENLKVTRNPFNRSF